MLPSPPVLPLPALRILPARTVQRRSRLRAPPAEFPPQSPAAPLRSGLLPVPVRTPALQSPAPRRHRTRNSIRCPQGRPNPGHPRARSDQTRTPARSCPPVPRSLPAVAPPQLPPPPALPFRESLPVPRQTAYRPLPVPRVPPPARPPVRSSVHPQRIPHRSRAGLPARSFRPRRPARYSGSAWSARFPWSRSASPAARQAPERVRVRVRAEPPAHPLQVLPPAGSPPGLPLPAPASAHRCPIPRKHSRSAAPPFRPRPASERHDPRQARTMLRAFPRGYIPGSRPGAPDPRFPRTDTLPRSRFSRYRSATAPAPRRRAEPAPVPSRICGRNGFCI